MQLTVITLILSKNISSDTRPAAIFISVLFGVLALWQTIEVWKARTSSLLGYQVNCPLLLLLGVLVLPTSVISEDQSFENWKNSHFENYLFECVETGSTQEYTGCSV